MKSSFTIAGQNPMAGNSPSAPAPGEHPLRNVFASQDLRRVLPGLVFSSLLSNLLAVALPMAILQIMDRVIINRSLETLAFLVAGIIMALILEEVLRSLNGLVTGWLGARFEHNTSVAALDRMMRVPLKSYQREEPGAYAEKILSSAKVAEFYSGQALLALFDLPFVLIFLALIYIISGWLVIVPTILLLVFAFLIIRFGHWMRGQIEQRNVMDDRRFNFLAEVLSNISSVKALTMESLMQRRYERLQEANAELGEKLSNSNTIAAGMGMLFSQIMIVAIVFAGAWVVIAGNMTPGALAACMMLSVRALQPLRRSLAVWLRYQSFTAAQLRLSEVMNMPCDPNQDKPALPPVCKSLELRDLCLRHEDGDAVLSGVSLKVEAGQCIAIQGDSGSGKTSLLSMINGLLQPDSGMILVDGRSITDFDADSIHKEIALLPQSSTIVAGTILENMTMYDTSLNSEVLKIAQLLGLDQVVAGMKLGYETPLGEGVSETLPEGVRQLINIVRALSRHPSVILFDEANISLDMSGDKRLRDYLAGLKGKCTMVLVTHRPSLLPLADKVFSLRDGQLLEGLLEATQKDADVAALAAAATIRERPEHADDIAAIVRRQFVEDSDLSRCLPPLLDALQWNGQPRELAEAMPHLAHTLDLSGLCSIMSNLEFHPRHVGGTLAHVDSRLTPCLFVPSGKPAKVILECLPHGLLRVFDSAVGAESEISMTAESGELYLFQKQESNPQQPAVAASWFGGLLWRFRRHIMLAFLLTLVSTILALATPLFVMLIYDRVIPTGDVVMGAYLMLGVAIAMTIDWLMRGLKSRVMSYIGGRTEYVLGSSLFQRLLSLPTSATEGATVSRQVGRIKNLESLREFFIGPLALLVFEIPTSLVMLIAIAFINPWIVGVVMLAAVGYALLQLASHKINEKSVANSSYHSALRWEFLNEALTNMRAIRSAGAGHSWVKRFREMSGKSVMASFRDNQMHARVSSIAQVLGTSTGLMALAVSAVLAIRGGLSGGAMIASMMIVWRLTGPMQNIFMAATSFSRIRNNIRQVENLMRLQSEHDNGAHQTLRPEMQGALGFARVSFRYARDADPALLGVSFEIAPGQVVVLAGINGVGKSTLLKLIVRVYQPQAGTIRLDNIDIRQLTAADLRARISYMPQSCDVFYGSVAQNLRLAHPAATDAELHWAVEMAGLTEDIQALPQGYETRISNSRSEQLPRGFRQRLSLARTLLKPASVVLLDEPGTGMDQAGEEALVRCIQYLRGRTTVLIASHRPGHMRLADTVIYMEHGSVSSMGSFEKIKDKVMAELR